MRKTVALISCLLILPSLAFARPACPKGGRPGEYSNEALLLCFQDIDTGQRILKIPSPDMDVNLFVHGDKATVQVAGRTVGNFPASIDQEVLWSPDSRALIVTSTFGASGPAAAYVYAVPGRGLPEVPDPTTEIRKAFADRHRRVECSDSVNVAGLGWADGSREALLIAQIPTTPHCGDSWGYFDVYALSVPEAKIIHLYPMAQALKRFRRLLGPRLRRDVPPLAKEAQRAPLK